MQKASEVKTESKVNEGAAAQYTRAASPTVSLDTDSTAAGNQYATKTAASTPDVTRSATREQRPTVPASTGSTPELTRSTNPSNSTSTAHHPSMDTAVNGATLYHNHHGAPLNPAAELYTPQAHSGDPASMAQFYCYGYVAPDGSMAYMIPYAPDATPYVHREGGEPPAGASEGGVPRPHPVPMPMPYSVPLYQHPYFYPGMGPYPYPGSTPHGMPTGMGHSTTHNSGYAAPPPASGPVYPAMYDSHSHAKPLYLGHAGGYAPHMPHAPAYAPYAYAEPGAAPFYGYAPNMVAPSMMGPYTPTRPAFAQNAPSSSSASSEATRNRRSSTTTVSGRSRRATNRRDSGPACSSSAGESASGSNPSGDDASLGAPSVPRTGSPPADAAGVRTEKTPDEASHMGHVASSDAAPAAAVAAPTTVVAEGGSTAVPSTGTDVPPADGDATVCTGPISEDQAQVKRSNFVMWCGNVPSDATVEELWQFFEQIPSEFVVPRADPPSDGPAQDAPSADATEAVSSQDTGILSIFIMSRSNCAFVNYVSNVGLERACAFFHGKPLRARPGCPRLVCRPRRLEDAEYAGVAAQRGKGVHTSWYRQQRQQLREQRDADGSLDVRANGDVRDSANDSDSRSFASTNSSLLRQPLFGHRYFILESRNAEALVTALRTNIWSTQPHNEGVLDQAFRNSAVVTLLFSENFSGQFFGYATMSSRIGGAMPHVEGVAQAHNDEPDRADVPAESEHLSRFEEGEAPGEAPAVDKANSEVSAMSSASATARSEAQEFEGFEELATSAKHHNRQLDALGEDESVLAKQDTSVGVRDAPATPPSEGPVHSPESGSTISPSRPSPLSSCAPETIHDSTSQLGRPFYIRWKNTKPLPFHEIQTLRNPWRDNRLVKVSRDGTELEPNVGAQLLAIWDAYAQTNPT